MRALFVNERRRPSRLAKRKREKFFAYSSLSIVLALSFFTLLAYISNKPDLLISNVTVQGSTLASSREISKRVENVLSGYYLALFPKRNSLIYAKRKLASGIASAFPSLDKVAINRLSFSSIAVSVHERDPYALWCPITSDDGMDKEHCYFIDKDGFIFFQAPDFSSSVYLRFIGPISTSTSIGGHVFPPERFREFSYFLQSLRDLNLFPVSISIGNGTAGIPDFTVALDSGVRLLISGSLSLENTLANIAALFTDPEFASSSTGFLRTISYIDFRFENKVFYK